MMDKPSKNVLQENVHWLKRLCASMYTHEENAKCPGEDPTILGNDD